MVDNVNVTPGIGEIVAADEVVRNAITEKQQIIKIGLGADGAHDTVVDSGPQLAADSLPVVQSEDAAAFETLVTVGFASITGAYFEIVNPAGNLKYIEIQNDTDANVIISLDAGVTDHWRIPQKEPRIFDVGQYGKFQTASIRVKHDGGAPTAGNLFLMAW